jgi:hypothetical protein
MVMKDLISALQGGKKQIVYYNRWKGVRDSKQAPEEYKSETLSLEPASSFSTRD